jgi:hypothetical protein
MIFRAQGVLNMGVSSVDGSMDSSMQGFVFEAVGMDGRSEEASIVSLDTRYQS